MQIHDANAHIQSLSGASVTNRGNQNALTQFLATAIVALQTGELADARQKLEQAISRTDGCALRGAADGNGPGRDWITFCEAQNLVYPLLIDALQAITP